MSTKQYTIRSIPEQIDAELRRRAALEQKSLNKVILESLERGLRRSGPKASKDDLDDLIGTWEEDPAFDAAVAEFERVDEEMWK